MSGMLGATAMSSVSATRQAEGGGGSGGLASAAGFSAGGPGFCAFLGRIGLRRLRGFGGTRLRQWHACGGEIGFRRQCRNHEQSQTGSNCRLAAAG